MSPYCEPGMHKCILIITGMHAWRGCHIPQKLMVEWGGYRTMGLVPDHGIGTGPWDGYRTMLLLGI